MNKVFSQKLTRSKFVKIFTRMALSLAGILGLGGLVRFFSHKPAAVPPRTYNLGPVDEFPSSGKLVRPDIPAVIYQHEDGFMAYGLICTHLGCTLETSENGFCCPCHGSEFGATGKVLKGPADKDLTSLEIEVSENGDMLVQVRDGGL
jgi:Rieske Fe-S protein